MKSKTLKTLNALNNNTNKSKNKNKNKKHFKKKRKNNKTCHTIFHWIILSNKIWEKNKEKIKNNNNGDERN